MSRVSEFCRDLHFVPIEFAELKDTAVGKAAKRDGLSFKETNNTQWFVLTLDNETVGVGGVIKVGGKLRAKAAYILPEWRKQGFYSWMRVATMMYAANLGCTQLEAIVRSTSKAALLQLGWNEVDKKSNYVYCNPSRAMEGLSKTDVTENLYAILKANGTQTVS